MLLGQWFTFNWRLVFETRKRFDVTNKTVYGFETIFDSKRERRRNAAVGIYEICDEMCASKVNETAALRSHNTKHTLYEHWCH